ncbi:hypothetical protein EDC96DRAFT_567933 [Choanephora cucurbitarum]|nr:hypothetical protein EDC96DRAFT_567933 [Choanephora cucurbitarum]
MSNINKSMNNNNSNAGNNARPKKYKGWSNDGCINTETNKRGLSSTELLFEWFKVPENLVAWESTGARNKQSRSGESRNAVLGKIIKYFEENGIHHRTTHQISTRVSQMKARYTNACRWMAQTGQGIRDQIFVVDDAVENEKMQDKIIQDHIKKVCPEFDRMNSIWGTSVLINIPCASSDSDDVEEIMNAQELMEPTEEELLMAERMAAQSEERDTYLELLSHLLDRQDERAQKRIKIDEELLIAKKSMASAMQTIANAIKAMADNYTARTKLSRSEDQRQALKELYEEGALTLEEYRKHVFETLGIH